MKIEKPALRIAGPAAAAAALLGAAALTACSQPTNQRETADTSMTTTDTTAATGADVSMPGTTVDDVGPLAGDVQGYVTAAASGDQFEIASSRIALGASQDKAVRSFAQRMIDDHTATSAALRQAASQVSGVTVPTSMNARHAGMLTQLEQSAKAGDQAAFDRLYIQQQRTAHQEAINLHQGMLRNTAAANEIQQVAAQALPKIQQHHSMIQQMGGSGSAMMKGGSDGTSAGTPTPPQNATTGGASGQTQR